MNNQTFLYKIKPGPGYEALIKEWFSTLQNEFKKESIKTLKEEQLLEESVKLICIDGSNYLLYQTQSSTNDYIPSNKTKWINRLHQSILGACISKEKYEITNLLDISTN